MAKFLMRAMPERETLYEAFRNFYPEVQPEHMYTHMWMRMAGSHLEDAVDDFLSVHKISSGRFLLLMVLEFNPDGMMPSDLAQSMGVTQSTVTGLINGLEDMGFAVRKDHHTDGRACYISLTENGTAFMQRVRPQFNMWVSKLYEPFTPEERQTLAALLQKFLENLKKNAPHK